VNPSQACKVVAPMLVYIKLHPSALWTAALCPDCIAKRLQDCQLLKPMPSSHQFDKTLASMQYTSDLHIAFCTSMHVPTPMTSLLEELLLHQQSTTVLC